MEREICINLEKIRRMNLEELVKNARVLATEVGGFILAQSGNVTTDSVEVKGLHDFVTYVDKEAEQRLVRGRLA